MPPASTPAEGTRVLISFDVDGTLIRSVGLEANALHKEAFSQAFLRVFGLETSIEAVRHHGSTDPLILIAVCVHHGIAKEEAMRKLPEMEAVMCSHFLANEARAGKGLEILPGVRDLLARLRSTPGVDVCLVTGNLEAIGWAKMRALGIADLFSTPPFGGFGSDYCSGEYEETWPDRAQLVRIAARKGAATRGPGEGGAPGVPEGPAGAPATDGGREGSAGSAAAETTPEPAPYYVRRYHVGDAPQDVRAAAAAGAGAVGVPTGAFSSAELLEAEPSAAVLPDGLRDLSAALKAFGLEPR